MLYSVVSLVMYFHIFDVLYHVVYECTCLVGDL